MIPFLYLFFLLAMTAGAHLRPPGKSPIRAPGRRLFHIASYALNDSFAGIRLAKRAGYKWIDLNFHVTLDGKLVCTHWGNPLMHGWYDPQKKLDIRTKVWNMTLSEVQRLRYHGRSGLRISTGGEVLRYAAKLKISVEFEAKESPQFNTEAPWKRLRAAVDATGVNLIVKTISSLGKSGERLRAAHAQGFRTMMLPRKTRRVPKAWWVFIDEVRGPVRWV